MLGFRRFRFGFFLAFDAADLQIAFLKDYVAEMQTANTTITQTATAAENARNARDQFLYNAANGIAALANKVKTYVKIQKRRGKLLQAINGVEN